MFFAEQGIENINPGNTGGTIDCGSFKVSFTQALHSSGTMVNGQYVYLGNPMGIVIEPKSGPTLYHMGDTDIFSDMALIEELHHPKDRSRAGRRPLHHGGKIRGAGGEALFPLRDRSCPAITGRSISSRATPSEFVAALDGNRRYWCRRSARPCQFWTSIAPA